MNDILERYLREEPDAAYRNQIQDLPPQVLKTRLEGLWRFGTAGFRAPMHAGYTGMNRVSLSKIAYALGKYLAPRSKVVIGYDGRHHSHEHAVLTARVLDALGHESWLFDKLLPTPICAFAIAELGAQAGVMITASHNPPQDNGIKIYGPDGAQLVAPATHQIEAILDQAPAYFEIPKSSEVPKSVPSSVMDAYFSKLPLQVCQAPISIVYTPMHGVGTEYAVRALKQAGFENIHVVFSQGKPDGDFPTVKFPNPEEPGALDEALKLAREIDADLILANDPDADRLAVCVGQKILSGNQVGILLGNYLLKNYAGHKKPLVMTTVVSSRMLSKIAQGYQSDYAETLTGFANIAHSALEIEHTNSERFIFGYEEALGYAVNDRVRDKDGISAAVLFAQLFSELKAQNKTVWQELEELESRYGVFLGSSWSVKGELNQILRAAENLTGFEKQKSRWPGLMSYTGDHELRLIIRPSGTEPKIKFYAEVIGNPEERAVLSRYLTQVQERVYACLLS